MKRNSPITPGVAVMWAGVISIVCGIVAALPAGSIASPSLVLHANLKMKPGTCSPGISSCTQAETYGYTDPKGRIYYYVYLLAAGFDTALGIHEVNVGIDYDLTTMSGVDIYDWTLCADEDSASSPDWLQVGGSNRIRWSAKGRDSLAVAGYFYVTAYSAGYLALVPPAGLNATFTPFSGPPEVIPPTSLGYVGFGDNSGCNPCVGNCEYTPVLSSTWSSLKLLHPSR